MLPQQQPVAALQLHIEGVLAGHGGVIAAAVIVPVLVALLGVLPIDEGDGALPGLIADAGADHHSGALRQGTCVVLVDIALHPEAAGLHDGHEGQGIAVLIGAAVLVDGLDPARHGRGDRYVLHGALQLLDILCLQRDIILLLQNIRGDLADLQGILHLLVGGGGVLVLFQLLLLLLLAGQLVLHLLQLQLGLLQIQLGLAHVVCKQGVALLDLLIHLHLDGIHRGVVVLLDLRLALRRDHSGKAIHQAGGAQPADHGHRLYRGFSLRACAAARQYGQQHHGSQRDHSKLFHPVSPCNLFWN